MAGGDETRPDNQPVNPLFGDGGSADETRLNPVPPPGPPAGRRSPVEPPGSYGVQPPAPYDQQYGAAGGGGGLFDEPAGQGGGPGRPTILANQAGEWERNLQEVEVVRSSRTGLVVLFLLALVVVAVIALALAAWSVLSGGDDDGTEAGVATDSTTTTIGDTSTSSLPDTTTTTVLAADELRVTVAENPFVCDSETREFALIGGADPNENVAFSSPQADGLRSGMADASGELPIRWQCEPSQAGTTWVLTATGETSGRSVTFQFAGVTDPGDPAPDPGDDPAPDPDPEPTALAVEVIENPFVCDSETRIFAGLSGAEPNEQVAFSSPQSPGLRSGTADADGNLPIRWNCDPDQAGTMWELTATGETSGRTVTFTFTGS